MFPEGSETFLVKDEKGIEYECVFNPNKVELLKEGERLSELRISYKLICGEDSRPRDERPDPF